VTDDSIVEHIQIIRIMMMFSLDIFRYTETDNVGLCWLIHSWFSDCNPEMNLSPGKSFCISYTCALMIVECFSFLFSLVGLYYVNRISQQTHTVSVPTQPVPTKKKK